MESRSPPIGPYHRLQDIVSVVGVYKGRDMNGKRSFGVQSSAVFDGASKEF
jgi:hypothetical protein